MTEPNESHNVCCPRHRAGEHCDRHGAPPSDTARSADTHLEQFKRSTRAAAYPLGYMLVLSFAVMGTLGMFVFGVSTLSGVDESAKMAAAENNLDRFTSDTNDVVQGAPYRVTEMKPTNSRLSYGGSVDVTVRASGGGVDLTGNDAYQVSTTTLQYYVEKDNDKGVTYRYAFGLVSREDNQGAKTLLRSNPNFRTGSNQTILVIPGVNQQPGSADSAGVSGNSKLPVYIESTDTQVVKRQGLDGSGNPTSMTGNVTIDDQADTNAWVEFFEDSGFSRPSGGYAQDFDSDGNLEVRGEFESVRLFIRFGDVEVALDDDT